VKIAATITFCQLLLKDAREVIVEQLELLGLMVREESVTVPIDVTVRADLVDLMARTLVVVFQAKGGRLMTELLCSPKIKPEHLARRAIVYLRQSSEKQVRYNLESQRLHYEVADRIRNLGWKDVEIIDSDLGFSAGMASARREGFERVLSWVALGEVGIVGSREVSRLSRTDKDWCRLLEVFQILEL
jgi:Resolvase, N terminal domain